MKRRLTSALLTLLVGLSASATGLAQDEGEVPVDDGGSSPIVSGKASPHTRVPVSVPIEGVTPENRTKLTSSVIALRHPVYRCPTCELQDRRSGPCEHCDVPREEAEPTEAVDRAEVAVDRRFLTVTMKPHHWGSLRELEGLVGEVGGRIRRAPFVLPHFSRILVSGLEDEKAAKRVRYALTDLKVLGSATAIPGPEAGTFWIIPKRFKDDVTLGSIEEALAKMRGTPTVADVQWAAYCPVCRKEATSEMGKPGCQAD